MAQAVWRGGLISAMLGLIAGCDARQQGAQDRFLERIARKAHLTQATSVPGRIAEDGVVAVTEECAKQSYENARRGLIVSETSLHEDVFALRDRASYAAVAYGLADALRLEALLDAAAKEVVRPADQADCIREFRSHLETLTDPIVEADRIQRELDVSAFRDASKQARELTDKRAPATERVAVPDPRSSQSHP